MTESEILSNLKALGAKDTTSDVQKKNGTTCFTLPTGDCISEHRTGYIRKNLLNSKGGIYTCYQLNPVYKTKWKAISSSGKLVESEMNSRMLIYSRAERLKKLLLYSIKQINNARGYKNRTS
tara:strand:+ start:286 stop:651 length:366 start_codon:yes stop_codon:yes gene_type:complete